MNPDLAIIIDELARQATRDYLASLALQNQALAGAGSDQVPLPAPDQAA